MFYKDWYRIKSSGDMDKDPFSWNKRIPITGLKSTNILDSLRIILGVISLGSEI